MRFSTRTFRLIALVMLTLACIAGAAALSLLNPRPAYAQSCGNGACNGILCAYRPGYACSFPDRNSCTTTRCAFIIH